jgi:hypothetical protein
VRPFFGDVRRQTFNLRDNGGGGRFSRGRKRHLRVRRTSLCCWLRPRSKRVDASGKNTGGMGVAPTPFVTQDLLDRVALEIVAALDGWKRGSPYEVPLCRLISPRRTQGDRIQCRFGDPRHRSSSSVPRDLAELLLRRTSGTAPACRRPAWSAPRRAWSWRREAIDEYETGKSFAV